MSSSFCLHASYPAINLIGLNIGGHTKAASYRSFYDNVQAIGPAEAIKIALLEYSTLKAVHAFSRLHGIDCEFSTRDTVDIVYDQCQWDEAVRSIELMRKLMPEDLDGAAQYTLYNAEDARDKFHCRGDKPLGAIGYQAGSLSAYKFVIEMIKICLERRLNLQTNTAATSLQKDANFTWKVETPRGSITANRVVLATNGYTAYLYKKLTSVIVPLRGQITAHRPGLNMPKEGLQTTYSFVYANGYEYMISRPVNSTYAGDIIMGGGLVKAPEEGLYEYGTTDDTALSPITHEYLVETTPRYFGDSWGSDHPEGRIRKAWTGIMGEYHSAIPTAHSNRYARILPRRFPICRRDSERERLVHQRQLPGPWHGIVLLVCKGFSADDA